MSAAPVYSLNVHAEYACRRSGACCTAGWSIPVEPRHPHAGGRGWILPLDDGACPEFDTGPRDCRLHRDVGEHALPESCFQFPRRALQDARGTFVTLSHFCRTAAQMLVDADTLAIVEQPPAFPASRRYEGLDARDEWPPLVAPALLFDHASYARWERFLVSRLASSSHSPCETLEHIAGAAERLREWTPACGPLTEWTELALTTSAVPPMPGFYSPCLGRAGYAMAVACVPAGLAPPSIPDDWEDSDATLVSPAWHRHRDSVHRYVATKAFGAWSAYDGHGVRTQVAELLLAATVLRIECGRACARAGRGLDRELLVEAVRAADWLLVHLVDRPSLMARLREVEAHVPSRPGA